MHSENRFFDFKSICFDILEWLDMQDRRVALGIRLTT